MSSSLRSPVPRSSLGLAAAILPAILLAGLPAALGAQSSASDEAAGAVQGEGDNQIVVTGQKPGEIRREVQRQARAIAVAPDARHTALARFEGRVCVGVMGLPGEQATYLVDRLRANASDLDIAVLGDNCSPNFVVTFVRDGRQAMADLRQSASYLFTYLDNGEKDALFEEEGPVRVWTNIQDRTRDGLPIPAKRDLVNPPVVQMAMAHSKIYTTTYPDIASVLIVIDLAAANGKSLLQLADYATMRGFARTRPIDETPAMDSILTLFEDGVEHPPALTEFDRAYLHAVYEFIPNLPAANKLGEVNRQLRILARDKEE